MVLNEIDGRLDAVLAVGRAMMTAARTAPKAHGIDIQQIAMVWGDDLYRLADKMRELGEQFGMKFFLRDALGVERSQAVVLVGTRLHNHGLNCGYCGSATCAAKSEAVPCYFNATDVGIALGSAAALAADMRVDTRIMFSAGISAQRLGLVDGCEGVLAIVLSCSSKSPFFDRVFEKK